MKFTAHIAVTALLVLVAAGGVLFPLRANIEEKTCPLAATPRPRQAVIARQSSRAGRVQR